MDVTDVQLLVEKGKDALKAGNRLEARHCLAQAVQLDARNEQAWLYLSALLPNPQAIAVLERVLSINPENKNALLGLGILRQQAEQSLKPEEPDSTAVT